MSSVAGARQQPASGTSSRRRRQRPSVTSTNTVRDHDSNRQEQDRRSVDVGDGSRYEGDRRNLDRPGPERDDGPADNQWPTDMSLLPNQDLYFVGSHLTDTYTVQRGRPGDGYHGQARPEAQDQPGAVENGPYTNGIPQDNPGYYRRPQQGVPPYTGSNGGPIQPMHHQRPPAGYPQQPQGVASNRRQPNPPFELQGAWKFR